MEEGVSIERDCICISSKGLVEKIRAIRNWLRVFDPALTDEKILELAIVKYYDKHSSRRVKNRRQIRAVLLADQKNRCHYCKKYLLKKDATVDHKVPLTLGGTEDPSNLCVACEGCNCLKGDMTEEEFTAFQVAVLPAEVQM